MKSNSSLQTLSIVTMTLAGIAIIGLIAYSIIHKPFDAKEYAKTNHCPYEGYECPNAQQCLQAADSIFHINDSLHMRITELETQLAGYELQDHSKITTLTCK